MFGAGGIGRIRRSTRSSRHTALAIAGAISIAALSFTGRAEAQSNPLQTLNDLTTGNGFGFQVFDTNQNKIVTFLDHPYRYISPPPAGSDPQGNGVSRRNLAFDIYFGVRAGSTTTWMNAPSSTGNEEYTDQSNIIHAPASAGSTAVDSYFFAPFGYSGNALVGVITAPGAQTGAINLNFHMGNVNGDPDTPDATGESVRASGATGDALVETGPGGGAMVYVALTGASHVQCNGGYATFGGGQDLNGTVSCSGTDQAPAMEQTLDATGSWAVAMQYIDDPTQADATAAALRTWANARTASKILTDAQAEFESWRVTPPAGALFSDDETKLWRQSEAVLRMGQIREVNTATRTNNGMILASLPIGQWHTAWVRDGTYATVALARMGHYAEAKAALTFFLNTPLVGKEKPVLQYDSFVGNIDYRISVCRYFGSGEEEADYSGTQSPNVELDGWGLVMWAARQYVQNSGDTAWLSSMTNAGKTVYDTIIDGIASPLQQNMETTNIAKADSSIWEVHEQNKRHFAYTSFAAARGFCDLAELALDNKSMSDVTTYQNLANAIKTASLTTFADQNDALIGSLEESAPGIPRIDAAVVEAFTWNLLPDFTGKQATATLALLDKLQLPSGGFFRNNDGLSSYDSNEWILIDFQMSNAYRRAGNAARADSILANLVTKAAANFYLLPELYNAVAGNGAIGAYAGSIPMVGYGGGTFVATILDRAGKVEPNDCGDGMSVVLPGTDGGVVTLADGGMIFTDDGGGGGGGGGGGSSGSGDTATNKIPYTPACLCNLARRSNGSPWLFAIGLIPFAAVMRRIASKKRHPRTR